MCVCIFFYNLSTHSLYIILSLPNFYQPVINYCTYSWDNSCSHLETVCCNCALAYTWSPWGPGEKEKLLVYNAKISLHLRWNCFWRAQRSYEVRALVCSAGRDRWNFSQKQCSPLKNNSTIETIIENYRTSWGFQFK